MGRARERRNRSSELTTRPPASPANLVILAILSVLGVTAAAAAVMGSGFDDVTPHGQLLGDLQRVAQAQETHYAETGAFAAWIRTLQVETNPDVRITFILGGGDAWEAVADHPAGLTCTQGGRAVGGVVKTDPPACFTTRP